MAETTTTAAPAGVISRLAIGDSVMQAAVSTLTDRYGFTVDAAKSRQFSEVVPVITGLVAQGRLDASSTVVIHLGTNGTIGRSDLETVLNELSGVGRVILVTGHADRSWIAGNNSLLAAQQGVNGNVTVLYWDALASGCSEWATNNGQSASCFASDGIHLNQSGVNYYVELIRATAGF